MIYGYAGQILRIDLTSGKITKEPLKQELVDGYLGGRGFTAKILYDENPPNVEPFDPENIIVIAMGPLSGHYLPASGKTHFCTKSPASGGYGDSNMGGHFGVNMKYAGYDVTIISGQAAEPSYILIDDDEVSIRPAGQYWGMSSTAVESSLKRELGEDYQVAAIGPAGEKLVRFACISHDYGRQAGRTGVGAVLGSKNIKALVTHGTGSIPVYDPAGLFEHGQKTFDVIRAKPGFAVWTPTGTAGIVDWVNSVGAIPTNNFQRSFIDYAEKINGARLVEDLKLLDKGCFACPNPCGKYGYAKTILGNAYVEGPEYETLAMLGSNCGLQDINEIAYANYLCDELGMDTCSAGVVVSFAIECFEKKLVSEEQLGMAVRFGDLPSVAHILESIAKRDGLGDVLAEGVKRAAGIIGQNSDHFAIHVKGLEWTGYESRNGPGMMLGYMTSDIGAHHARCWVLADDFAATSAASGGDFVKAESASALVGQSFEFKPMPKAVSWDMVPKVIASQSMRPAYDIMGVCRLQTMELGLEPEYYEDLLYCTTGRKLTWDDVLKYSEKVWQLTRAYNCREIDDFGRKYDYPPPRFYKDAIPEGPSKGHFLDLELIEDMLDKYYEARGWDKNGIPTKETLARFGLPTEAGSTGGNA